MPRIAPGLAGCIVALLLLAGCTLQRGAGTTAPTRPSRSQNQPASLRDYGPAYATFEEAGIKWIRGSTAFPTGRPESSGLLVEKTVPAEVMIGKPLDYAYKVSNLLDTSIQEVVLMDRVSGSFNPSEAEPKPSDTKAGIATWQLGTLAAHETKTVHVRGTSGPEGVIGTCGWATYTPVLCQDIKVVRADMQLSATSAPDVLICEPIPMVLSIRNTGSSTLNAVKATVTLPEGLTSNRRSTLTLDGGILTPGQTRDLKFNVTAARTGKFVVKAHVTTALGLEGETSVTTTVHQPVLTLTGKAPEEQYAGRPFDLCFTISNKSDGNASATVLEVPIPSGISFKGATANGRARAGSVVWDVGQIPPGAARDFCATFVSSSAGDVAFSGSARSLCAVPVSATSRVHVVGVAAILLEKADDPDPVGVGETTTYTVKITNQGTADDSNVRTVVTLPPELAPVNVTGGGSIDGQTVTFPALIRLSPKETITYKIVAKGVKPGDGRTRFVLTSGILKSPVTAEESTHVY